MVEARGVEPMQAAIKACKFLRYSISFQNPLQIFIKQAIFSIAKHNLKVYIFPQPRYNQITVFFIRSSPTVPPQQALVRSLPRGISFSRQRAAGRPAAPVSLLFPCLFKPFFQFCPRKPYFTPFVCQKIRNTGYVFL